MRAKFFVLLSAVSLGVSGCSTYSSTTERPPLIDITSDKDPATYLGCLEPAFAEIWPQSKTMRDGTASVVMVPVGGNVPVTVHVTGQASGSRVQYRQQNDLNVANFKKGRNAVVACK
ncbi:hypothetical protein LL962_16715 [Xanthomonas sp. NCPPB 1067]|uniref:hypothetical protein n=1 Tax=Xanthomonas sp. NCPPB 1067 TaxID=487524 RepID=UPI001E611AC7|nr:hypothetical protein [Xanthomonas sp. NCPPB 1067]MCC4588723.1 hypothetical protein [Xanthomonas sp. NCPPB 1067]